MERKPVATPVIPPPPDYVAPGPIPPPPDAVPAQPAAVAAAPPTVLQSAIRAVTPPDPFTVAGNALHALRIPLKAAFDLAGNADVAAGIKTPERAARLANTYANIPIPVAAGMLTGGMSLPAQALAQATTTAAMQGGGLEPKSLPNVAFSAAAPFAGEAISRLIRGLGRTATRVIPGLFQRAQAKAQGELGKVAGGLATEESGPLFKGARAVGDQRVGAGQLTAMLDDLDQSIPKDPISPGLKAAREFMERGRELTQGGEISLGDLMRFRQDLGPMTRQAPQIGAIYKATLGDLEAGSTAGSRLAVEALSAARKTHGSALFSDLVEKATEVRSVAGADAPALNVAKLAKGVHANREDLVKFLGPQGVGQIEQFLAQYRSLPPTHAWTAVNKAIATGAGGLGFLGGGLPAVAAAGLPELLTNMYQVGGNPAFLRASRLAPLLAGARAAGAGGLARDAVESRR